MALVKSVENIRLPRMFGNAAGGERMRTKTTKRNAGTLRRYIRSNPGVGESLAQLARGATVRGCRRESSSA